MLKLIFIFICSLFFVISSVAAQHLINDVQLFYDGQYQMIVEIPSGTNEKWEVNKESGLNELEMKNGKPRIIKFLPYPGNYGFLPQTLSGDNDPLDIIFLNSSLPRGSIHKVNVIGALMYEDKGEEDFKVIAIPIDEKQTSIEDYMLDKPNAVLIIKLWFESYKKPGKMVFKGFLKRDEVEKYIYQSHLRWKAYKTAR